MLSSSISPFWLAGRLLAFTTTVSPAVTEDDDNESEGWRASTRPSTPRTSRTTTPIAIKMLRRLCDRALATGTGVIAAVGMGTGATATAEGAAASGAAGDVA